MGTRSPFRYTYSRRVDRRTSSAVSAAMLAMPPPSGTPVHTVTADNGREFAGHAGVAEALKAGLAIPRSPAIRTTAKPNGQFDLLNARRDRFLQICIIFDRSSPRSFSTTIAALRPG